MANGSRYSILLYEIPSLVSCTSSFFNAAWSPFVSTALLIYNRLRAAHIHARASIFIFSALRLDPVLNHEDYSARSRRRHPETALDAPSLSPRDRQIHWNHQCHMRRASREEADHSSEACWTSLWSAEDRNLPTRSDRPAEGAARDCGRRIGI